jgi:hypothetical protein
MNDYCIHKVGVTLEAALIGLESNGLPSTWATLRSLSVKRSYLGDVNCDGYINSADISLVQGSLDSQFGSSNYLPAADINKDKSINQADLNLVAQFPDYGWLTVTVPQAPDKGYDTDGTPREPVTVWLDGTQYALYKSTSARVLRTVGQNYRIQAQTSFVKEEWTPGTYFIYKFSYWSDGSTDNPHTFTNFAGDTTRSPFYRRLPYGIR